MTRTTTRTSRLDITGHGSSYLQSLHGMVKLKVTQVISFQRGVAWIVSRDALAKLAGTRDLSSNPEYTEEDKGAVPEPGRAEVLFQADSGGFSHCL